MANGDTPSNLALQDAEDDSGDSGVNDVLSGGNGRNFDAGAQPPSTAQTAPQSTPNASAGPSTGGIQQTTTPSQGMLSVDTSEKIHPHMAILAGLANKLLSAVQNAPGNPRNAFDRGFMNASPNNQAMQQAAVSQAQSAADLAKLNNSITGMKAIQLEYMIKRLPQQLQQEHLDKISEFKQNLIKEGASVEAEGDDEKASDGQAAHLNATDPRALQHAGKFYSLPTMDKDGNAKFDVVFVPNKDTLQNDFTWTDPDGNEQTVKAGTSLSATFGRFVEMQNKGAQNQTKEQHKQMADALGPVSDEKAGGTADWLESQKKQNTPLYQQNKQAADTAIGSLRAQGERARQEKLGQAKAMATQVTIPTAEAKEGIKHDYDTVYARDQAGELVASNRKTATEKGYTDIDDTITKADAAADRKVAPLLDDVRSKFQDYADDIKKNGDLSKSEAVNIQGILALSDSQFEAKLEPFGIGVGVKPSTEQLNNLLRDFNINHASDRTQNRLATYIAARSAALELQKAQTQSARASKEGLTLDLNQIPDPGLNGRMANRQLMLLQQSINRISEHNPFTDAKEKKRREETAKLLRSMGGS